jgi:hypothetical protein
VALRGAASPEIPRRRDLNEICAPQGSHRRTRALILQHFLDATAAVIGNIARAIPFIRGGSMDAPEFAIAVMAAFAAA